MLYDLWERYRTWIIVLGISLFVCLSFWFYPGATEYGPAPPFQTAVFASEDQPPQKAAQAQQTDQTAASPSTTSMPPATSNPNDSTAKEQPRKLLYIDLKGSVKHPGVYPFEPNERVHDLIQKAGGLLPDADQNRINLAQSLTDGMVIWVPSKTDQAPNIASNYPFSQTSPQTTHPETNQLAPTSQSNERVNINTASIEQLKTLPGIGETRAKAIISYRESKGEFRSIEQLQEIQGIGEKLFAKIKDKISLQ
ncbi:helix-hairpin-helix domain-containing protein [Brevibacillus ginsengisoli]|uniref:helix-hairpin-helix domain-containing protein n=1 Tax=Brevibacillus ginsengisoli TaxID=363854 RepID=UPI003CF1EE22